MNKQEMMATLAKKTHLSKQCYTGLRIPAVGISWSSLGLRLRRNTCGMWAMTLRSRTDI